MTKTLGRALTTEEREAQERRRTIQLALTRARADREAARSDGHRRMLDAAIAALQDQLQRFK